MCATRAVNNANPTEVPARQFPTIEFPYQVILEYPRQNSVCGASIIAPLLLLTAAQCVWRKKPSELYAVAGENKQLVPEGTEQTLRVRQIIIHRNFTGSKYGERPLDNDIAILVLTQPIKFNNYVKPIQIPHQQQILPGKIYRIMFAN